MVSDFLTMPAASKQLCKSMLISTVKKKDSLKSRHFLPELKFSSFLKRVQGHVTSMEITPMEQSTDFGIQS